MTAHSAGGYAFCTLFNNYRARARRNGLAFGLTRESFRNLVSRDCHYCGLEPKQRINSRYITGPFIYHGIARKDNLVGYTEENCVPCCGRCNTLKSNLSYDEFRGYLVRIIRTRGWVEGTGVRA